MKPLLPDLHRHLDGSLRASTFHELARARGADVAPPRFRKGMGLGAALDCFSRTLAVLNTPAAISRVASEVCEDAAADGVSTLEIRFDPYLHGDDADSIVDAALDGIAGRAGLVLCGLYGDSPEVLDSLVDLARPGVVGLDLAGGPNEAHRYGLRDYASAFRRASVVGLGCTVHAAEGRSATEIVTAIEHLGAHRIGHGTTLLDDPRAVEAVLDAGVVIEACITSNVHVGAIPTASDHPLVQWLVLGVRCCVNTDNTLMSNVDSSGEHEIAASLKGMTPGLLAEAVRWGHASAFGR